VEEKYLSSAKLQLSLGTIDCLQHKNQIELGNELGRRNSEMKLWAQRLLNIRVKILAWAYEFLLCPQIQALSVIPKFWDKKIKKIKGV